MQTLQSPPTDVLSPAFQAWLIDTAEQHAHLTLEELSSLEETLAGQAEATTEEALALRAAVKLAHSRRALREAVGTTEVSLTIVVPMYGETDRLKPRGSGLGQHPHGEDALRSKVQQLTWLTQGTPVRWRLILVDDQSKDQSGEAAAATVTQEGWQNVEVRFLDSELEATDASLLIQRGLRGVTRPKSTRKAAAVLYGMAYALETAGDERHFIGYTDMDLSVHAGLLGQFVAELLAHPSASLAAASRRLPTSVLKLGAARNFRANLARYFRTFMIGDLVPKDTQCGLKLFRASALRQLYVQDALPTHLDMSFDVPLLAQTALLGGGADAIVPVPVAAFDSADLSNSDGSVHWTIHRAGHELGMARTGHQVPEAVARLSGALAADEALWQRALEVGPQHPDLVAKIEQFDPQAAVELEALLKA